MFKVERPLQLRVRELARQCQIECPGSVKEAKVMFRTRLAGSRADLGIGLLQWMASYYYLVSIGTFHLDYWNKFNVALPPEKPDSKEPGFSKVSNRQAIR